METWVRPAFPALPAPASWAPSGQPGISTLEAQGSRVSWDSCQARTQLGAKTHLLQEPGAPPCGKGECEGLHMGCVPGPLPPAVTGPLAQSPPQGLELTVPAHQVQPHVSGQLPELQEPGLTLAAQAPSCGGMGA